MGDVNFIIVEGLNKEKIFSDSTICRKCGGICCKNCGCTFSPNDFYVLRHQNFSEEERYRYLKHFLKRGYACISIKTINASKGSIFGDVYVPRHITLEYLLSGEAALYLRMRNKGEKIVKVIRLDEKTNGCVCLGKNGCKFPFSRRPRGGRELIPNVVGNCAVAYPEILAAIEWYPYQKILYKLYLEFNK